MKKIVVAITFLITLGCVSSYAQNTDKEQSAEEVAEKHVADLKRRLKLDDTQEFYVDSILMRNYTGMKEAMEELKKSGMQDPETYRYVSTQWTQKTIDAMKKVLDDQQFVGYLKFIGKGQEYKKGKDGRWYLKSELKKQKKSPQ